MQMLSISPETKFEMKIHSCFTDNILKDDFLTYAHILRGNAINAVSMSRVKCLTSHLF